MPRYFTDEHEWIDVEGDTATVGITDYAQGQLGDIVFVELPQIGSAVAKGKDAAVVESVKAAQLVMNALLMAIFRRGRPRAVLHHSDQGSPPVHQRRLPAPARIARHRLQHEPSRQLLGQRCNGKLFLHAQD